MAIYYMCRRLRRVIGGDGDTAAQWSAAAARAWAVAIYGVGGIGAGRRRIPDFADGRSAVVELNEVDAAHLRRRAAVDVAGPGAGVGAVGGGEWRDGE